MSTRRGAGRECVVRDPERVAEPRGRCLRGCCGVVLCGDIATANGLYVTGDDPPGALPIIGKPSQNAPCAQLEVREQLSVSS